jgi:hypothetical protein
MQNSLRGLRDALRVLNSRRLPGDVRTPITAEAGGSSGSG